MITSFTLFPSNFPLSLAPGSFTAVLQINSTEQLLAIWQGFWRWRSVGLGWGAGSASLGLESSHLLGLQSSDIGLRWRLVGSKAPLQGCSQSSPSLHPWDLPRGCLAWQPVFPRARNPSVLSHVTEAGPQMHWIVKDDLDFLVLLPTLSKYYASRCAQQGFVNAKASTLPSYILTVCLDLCPSVECDIESHLPCLLARTNQGWRDGRLSGLSWNLIIRALYSSFCHPLTSLAPQLTGSWNGACRSGPHNTQKPNSHPRDGPAQPAALPPPFHFAPRNICLASEFIFFVSWFNTSVFIRREEMCQGPVPPDSKPPWPPIFQSWRLHPLLSYLFPLPCGSLSTRLFWFSSSEYTAVLQDELTNKEPVCPASSQGLNQRPCAYFQMLQQEFSLESKRSIWLGKQPILQTLSISTYLSSYRGLLGELTFLGLKTIFRFFSNFPSIQNWKKKKM